MKLGPHAVRAQYGFAKDKSTFTIFDGARVDTSKYETSTTEDEFTNIGETCVVRGNTHLYGVPEGTYAGRPVFHNIIVSGRSKGGRQCGIAVRSRSTCPHSLATCPECGIAECRIPLLVLKLYNG